MDDFTLNKCNEVMRKIKSHPLSELFLEPVDPVRDEAPDYFKTIKKPMDLSTVQSKLNKKLYKNVQEWKDDMTLISANAIQYNGRKNYLGQVGVEFQKIFKELSKTVSDGILMNWYNELLEIKKALNSHALAKVQQIKGEANMLYVNPKYQTKDLDTFPEMHRFLIGSMTIEELNSLKEKILKVKDPEKRKEIKMVINKYTDNRMGDTINLQLLPPAALIELKELC